MKKILIYLLFLLPASVVTGQESFREGLCKAALELTEINVVYDPGYYVIAYPLGDIPEGRGVCTDVVVRAYRALGIDLQKEVHEDMKANFDHYPDNWGLNYPDKNIDHRRVPNLMVYFERFGNSLTLDRNSVNYKPGEIVCWDLGGGITHIGIVSDKKSADGLRYQIVHNIGEGQVLEDCLFEFKIIGHYYYEQE